MHIYSEEYYLEYSYSSYHSLSTDPGVYIFRNKDNAVIYVGKAKNLKKRVSTYFTNKDLGEKTRILVSNIDKIETIIVDSELESLLLEANLIKKYNPKYNARLTDGKAYILARITIKDKCPKILLSRRDDNDGSIYFGPFPSSNDLKIVLKLIRKIFPYQSVANHPKRICLYNHLKLCPCPPMFINDQEIIGYKKNIKHIIDFFEGNTKKIIADLEKERDVFSKKEKYEEASEIHSKIDSIIQITTRKHNPFEYEQNPNLRSDLRSNEIQELTNVLNNNGLSLDSLNRIECYDISNISGVHATGSMVVFTNGEKDSSNYRRFKIKRPPKTIPNDFAMMREVIMRRLTHKEWEKPNLIIVDGGKGQITSAKKALFESNIDIPLIGIAKKQELLITSEFITIKLPRNSDALNLVKRIRDEAHRFAITYHKKLRSKYLIPS